ncbi:MAG TPA: rhomboid family intramembrane serine protease [Rhizomicrobium sp.]|jgi:membrane associated rhomboid family serine protease|nr:rhomboid family intramembrane serine protease [Rhizomicrobium sp.]
MAFFQEPRRPREPILRAPTSVLWLIVALGLAHVGRIYAPQLALALDWLCAHLNLGWRLGANAGLPDQILLSYAFIPARYSAAFLAQHGADPGTWFEQAVPFVSYIFLHANFTHLIINCLWLLAFGPIVARRYGTPLFLFFFLLCGIAGAAAYLLVNWGSVNPVIGASGAISGLMAASVRMLRTLRYPPDESGPLSPIFSSQVLIFTGIWAALNVLAGVTGFGTGSEGALVAWQAHLGGYAAGLLLAGPFDVFHRRRARTA